MLRGTIGALSEPTVLILSYWHTDIQSDGRTDKAICSICRDILDYYLKFELYHKLFLFMNKVNKHNIWFMIIYVFEIYPFRNIYLIKKACNNFLCLIVHKVCVYIIHILFLYSLVAKQLFLLNFLWHCEREREPPRRENVDKEN